MPTYDYRCKACGHAFEHFQSISSSLLRKCPECGKPKLERLIGAGAGLLFKGSGFYITDYRNSAYHDAAKKDAPAPSAESAAGSSKDGKDSKGAKEAPKESSKDSGKGAESSPAPKASPPPAVKKSSPAPSKSAPKRR